MQLSDYQFIKVESIKFPLLNQFYKHVYKKGLARKNEVAFALQGKTIICSAKLKRLGDQQLLTGVACDPQYRGQGYASQLINNILLTQQSPIYCFPYAHLQPFYTKLGFVSLDARSAPDIISQQFTTYSKKQRLLLMVFNP